MTSQRDDHGFDLIGYADRTLDDEERRRVARHLEHCPRCADEVRALEAGAEAVRSLRGSLDEPERALVDRTLDRIAVERASVAALVTDEEPVHRAGRSPRLGLVAAVLLALGIGWASGWASRAGTGGGAADGGGAAGAVAAVPEPPTHALLLVASDSLGGTRSERFEAYARWAGELRAADRLTMAEALSPTAYRVDGRGDAPEAFGGPGAFGSLLGFFLLRVPDDESALEIARASPHVGFGGEILVRPIYPTPRVEP